MKTRAFTLIELMIVIAIIAIIAAIAIPNLIEARKSGNESAAIGALRTISTAQTLFRESDRGGEAGVLDYATSLTALSTAGVDLIDDVLGRGVKQGYVFTMNPVAVSDVAFEWNARAEPTVPGSSGDRYFFIDQSGVIRFSTTAAATSTSSPLGR